MSKAANAVNGILRTLGVLGSLFVKKTVDGKYEVAVAPVMVAVALGSAATCAVQDDEPFRQCVRSTISMFKEVANAD